MTTRSEYLQLRIDRRDGLFDLLVANPDGVTIDDIIDLIPCTREQGNQAIRDLRLFLGDIDDNNVPCIPNGLRRRWLYTLRIGSADELRKWSDNRINDTESRLRTMDAMMASAVSATDGRTAAGKRARVMERALRRLVEDLDTLIVDLDVR